ncbi:hypothetical protein ACHQM5_024750 [Ranunculus cassubicifolius]
MGKKKFLDKKKSATFQLYARDSAAPNYNPDGPSGDRVFVRVDNNYSYNVPGFGEVDDDDVNGGVEDPDSIFADAPEDGDDEDNIPSYINPIRAGNTYGRSSLPDNVRREILELGFPDDGYNYLLHMREIKNTGGGSAYYENTKAIPEPLSLDVKAYDASRVRVPPARNDDDSNDNSIYSVAAKTVGVRVQKAVDPEVAALLDNDDDDLSKFGSDVEDLEEDFVVQANVHEVEEGDDDDVGVDNKMIVEPKLQKEISVPEDRYFPGYNRESEPVYEKPRVLRPVDEQFDQLCLQEYGTESDSDHGGSMEEECLVDKLNNHVLINHVKDGLELDGGYKVPADILREKDEGSDKEEYAQLIKRTAELGNMHDNEEVKDEVVVIEEESSDDDERWDCETIVTTYSNLDNHPGKIEAPSRKKKLLPDFASVVSSGDGSNMIPLGKHKIPVDISSIKKSQPKLEKIKEEDTADTVMTPSLQRRSGESKEEKKERKAAVKEERREARKAKKELKGVYRCEAQRAQKVAAFSGPSAIHLM